MITLSGLGHVAACPGSAALPRIRREGTRGAPIGRAIHAMVDDRINGRLDTHNGIAFAHGLDADDAGRLSFLATHLQLPVPAGALAEVPLGYFPNGSTRRIEGGAGEYTDVGQLLSGTLDAMWAEPAWLPTPFDHLLDLPLCPPDSTLWIVDWKTGDEENVVPIERNWQLRAGALMAARWTGARRVIPAICYINAAECAEAVREGRPYTGRWEVGAVLDAAALDAIEVELRAVLARARGEEDVLRGGEGDGQHIGNGSGGQGSVRGRGDHDARAAADGGEGVSRACRVVTDHGMSSDDGRPAVLRHDRGGRLAPLVLGPHCEHCPARGACPAIAAEAVNLARGEGLYIPPGAALTSQAASWLAGILGPARRMLDAAESALRAHVRAHGPVRLADGREWGPELETVTRYKTAETFEALAAVVGEARANEAFATSTTALRDAVSEGGRGAWKRLKEDIEARGGAVPGAREVWRKRWPAKPVEVVSDGSGVRSGSVLRGVREEGDVAREEVGSVRGQGGRNTGGDGDAGGGDLHGGLAMVGRDLDGGASDGERTELRPTRRSDSAGDAQRGSEVAPHAPGVLQADQGASGGDRVALRGIGEVTRAPCPVCGRSYTLAGGRLRKHAHPGGGLRCAGSGQPPAQLEIRT